MATKRMHSGNVKTGGYKVKTSAEKPNRVQHGAMASEKTSPSVKKTVTKA